VAEVLPDVVPLFQLSFDFTFTHVNFTPAEITVDPSFVQGPPALGVAAKTGPLVETHIRLKVRMKVTVRFI
jgi:hypothetical protein